ncbi:COG4315 family predicted lipoprotein [Arthrobacter sp. MAHUQ-56]
MKKPIGAGLAILALAAALAACGSNNGTSPASSTASSAASPTAAASGSGSAQASAAAELMTASSSAGTIVVDAKGMSVYFFTKDTKDSGTSACTGACLVQWPPVTTTSATPAASGITGTLGTIPTPDGKKQVTLNGMPLYYFAKDTKAGDVLGQGVNNVWYLANPAGDMIRPAGGQSY